MQRGPMSQDYKATSNLLVIPVSYLQKKNQSDGEIVECFNGEKPKSPLL